MKYLSAALRTLFLILITAFCGLHQVWAAPAKTDPVFKPVEAFLLDKGYSPAMVTALFSDPRVEFEAKILARMLSVRESKLNYKQFLKKKVIRQAKAFLEQHQEAFALAKSQTGVEPEVVVAILSVETRLGSYTGENRVFNVLASQAVLDTPLGKKRLAAYWPAKRSKQVYSARNKKRFAKRSRWAMPEVAALLEFCQGRGLDPLSVKGSPAGAMGMAQFVPSSILTYARDGNQDGVIELHHAGDAICSVANYLRKNGWRPGLSHSKKVKIVLTYNNSTPYATTVLELARRVR